ncbi:hypothetical protein [Arthrobacter sp. SD76]|uniref:hypothetical protein n=1 Tax=Arthrobacter sp. SD76 TaxID=3415007 RepID=UPI003C779020
MQCPECGKPLGALTAVPHCKHKECSWTKCSCGTTIDRGTGAGFSVKAFYPADDAA